MPRQHTATWDDHTPTSLAITCGWCSIAVEAIRLPSSSIEVDRRDAPLGQIVRVTATYRCPRAKCGWPSLAFFDLDFHRGQPSHDPEHVGTLPRGKAVPMDGLPEEVMRDRDEAWSCYHGGDLRASVIMGRAAIQRAARTLKASGGGLKAEINDLRQKGTITQSLKEWADEVRIAGDEAAHPEDLGEVKREEAEESLTFMDAFLDHAIALPARRDARKAARKP